MEQLISGIEALKKEISEFSVSSKDELESFRVRFIGSRGAVKALMSEMKNIPADRKKEAGALLNDLKLLAEQAYDSHSQQVNTASSGKEASSIDVTLPGYPNVLGGRHPIRIIENRIISIFNRLGFSVAEGPEIEDDYHNFSALNLPQDHPARDMQDTFYISKNPDWLLRTHTSSIQIREMEKSELPLRIICLGRVYRNETISARAHCFFHQMEGLYIAENVSFADLKQTLYFFVREMFGEQVKVRFRPSYFPFTEPSAEMDISCRICEGEGCSVCKKTGWVEILGCGMVHPNVLENCGIDSKKYTGFAFGLGIERIAMLHYQIKDLRYFSENDRRFLQQFVSA
jgi:phenylalanyl-tRNA synthetase alpha chain